MKFTHASFALALSAICAFAQTPTPSAAQRPQLLQLPNPATNSGPLDKEKTGYALGLMQGNSIKSGDLGIDYQSLIEGMTDALISNKPPKMTEAEAKEWYGKWQMQRRNQMMEKQKQDAEKRKTEGVKNKADVEAFLAKNTRNQVCKRCLTDCNIRWSKKALARHPNRVTPSARFIAAR
jgi:hypothetical protein